MEEDIKVVFNHDIAGFGEVMVRADRPAATVE